MQLCTSEILSKMMTCTEEAIIAEVNGEVNGAQKGCNISCSTPVSLLNLIFLSQVHKERKDKELKDCCLHFIGVNDSRSLACLPSLALSFAINMTTSFSANFKYKINSRFG